MIVRAAPTHQPATMTLRQPSTMAAVFRVMFFSGTVWQVSEHAGWRWWGANMVDLGRFVWNKGCFADDVYLFDCRRLFPARHWASGDLGGTLAGWGGSRQRGLPEPPLPLTMVRAAASWSWDANDLTIHGEGAYLGLSQSGQWGRPRKCRDSCQPARQSLIRVVDASDQDQSVRVGHRDK